MEPEDVKKIVKEKYAKAATTGCGCSCNCESPVQISKSIGYSDQEINNIPDANLGLGCGNPTALGEIVQGETVLDLGSGAGFDTFLAANKVGDKGYVIGVDLTTEMIEKAKNNAIEGGYNNVDFRLGDIENLPIDDNSIDVIISNCVINLAPDKSKVFEEVYRVLKPGGRMYISDIVLLNELTEEQRTDKELIASCVGGAILKDKYLHIINTAGLKVKDLNADKDISKNQYEGMPVESLNIVAYK